MASDIVYLTIIGLIIAGTTIAVSWYYNTKTRKDNQTQTRQTLEENVEKAFRVKLKEEKETAKEVSDKNRSAIIEVKEDIKAHIDTMVATLKADIELQKTIALAQMDKTEMKVSQIRIDLMEHIANEKDERIRMQRSIDFLQTMNFGPESKSIPSYMETGEPETQEHKEEPEKGVFASRKDTTHKDTKDPVRKQDPSKDESK